MLLAYRENASFFAVGQRLDAHHQTVQRCVERAVADGALAALDDTPRPGKEPVITPEAKAWLVSLACDKAKDHGYPHEMWTTRLLARHAREHGPGVGPGCLAHLVQGTVCKLLGQEEMKPHKVRYYLERRDAEFEQKMAEVLYVYREVQVLKKAAAKSKKPDRPVTIVSYDEKPGIQAIATTAVEPGPLLGRERKFEAARRSRVEPGPGFSRDVCGMIIEDQLDRGPGRMGGIEKRGLCSSGRGDLRRLGVPMMAEQRRNSRLMTPKTPRLWPGDEDAARISCVVTAISLVDIGRSITQPVSVSVQSMTPRKV